MIFNIMKHEITIAVVVQALVQQEQQFWKVRASVTCNQLLLFSDPKHQQANGWADEDGEQSDGPPLTPHQHPGAPLETWEVLVVHSVNVERKLNTAAHHTSDYQTKKLVLRRGQIFTLKVILNRPLHSQDELKVTFTTGYRIPFHVVELDPMTSHRSKGWQVKIAKQSGVEVVLNVISAPDAAVGRYKLSVNEHKAGVFFLLFNPWCSGNSEFSSAVECVPFTRRSCVTLRDVPVLAPSLQCRVPEPFFALTILSNQLKDMTRHNDSVFMASEEERAEYTLNDTGYIYMGFAKQIKEKPWTYGQNISFYNIVYGCTVSITARKGILAVCSQGIPRGHTSQQTSHKRVAASGRFEKHVLNCCFNLLAEMEHSEMQNPVFVSRAICTLMCAANGGVLVGNWTGDYPNGTAPYVWTSSVPILQQHYVTRLPVRYGQCWVFSGILTTALRAVGIPARSVTNFESAHDTEKNLRVDIYLDESGKTIPQLTRDSVWNFHVWTDAWMKRHDLPQGHDGWQVLDSTPQEISEGGYRTGPSPLTAIRQGLVQVKYDTTFVFTEVNGDKFIWLVKHNQERDKNVLIAVETASIGKNISTKMVGESRREDVTLQYKFPEGSPEERKAMEKASGKRPDDKHSSPPLNNALQISVLQNSVELGYPINLTITLRRKTTTPQNVNISCSLDLQTYTGKKKANLGVLQKTVQMQGQESEVFLSMDPSFYIYKLGMVDDEMVIKGFIIAEMVDSGERVATDTTLCFLYSAFSVEMPSTCKVNHPLVITCTFKNTLPIPLTNIRFSVESLGLTTMKSWEQETVPPGKTINFQMECTPVKAGPKKFIVKFLSRQVKEVHAEKVVLITT
ncbi:protein-glutamine gamma-glutamyltransferase 4 [Arvicanthis niloticus]|uniref:protein-glutamine gamma-glutamyltransferase 4 n=1 Tax=Arvicanthis niloticus TaxID=61156 RepID=UPI00402B62E5